MKNDYRPSARISIAIGGTFMRLAGVFVWTRRWPFRMRSKMPSNLDIKSAQRVRLTNVSSNLAARKYNSNVTSLKFNHQHSKHASGVHLTYNTKSFADQKHNSFLHPTNNINCTSAHDQRVHSTQNNSVFAHTYPTSKVNNSKLINTTSYLASRVRFSFNKLTPARHNTLLNTQKTRMHSSDASSAKQVTKYPIHFTFASHSLPFTINSVQIEPEMLVKTKKRHSLTKILLNLHQ